MTLHMLPAHDWQEPGHNLVSNNLLQLLCHVPGRVRLPGWVNPRRQLLLVRRQCAEHPRTARREPVVTYHRLDGHLRGAPGGLGAPLVGDGGGAVHVNGAALSPPSLGIPDPRDKHGRRVPSVGYRATPDDRLLEGRRQRPHPLGRLWIYGARGEEGLNGGLCGPSRSGSSCRPHRSHCSHRRSRVHNSFALGTAFTVAAVTAGRAGCPTVLQAAPPAAAPLGPGAPGAAQHHVRRLLGPRHPLHCRKVGWRDHTHHGHLHWMHHHPLHHGHLQRCLLSRHLPSVVALPVMPVAMPSRLVFLPALFADPLSAMISVLQCRRTPRRTSAVHRPGGLPTMSNTLSVPRLIICGRGRRRWPLVH
mmetsp:Transcript_21735/g.61660  ORF Transcript_21735/g.61660 Transcript_21735/m.61660 type:complete len:361 (-) Transcript_21735:150-1232(-)